VTDPFDLGPLAGLVADSRQLVPVGNGVLSALSAGARSTRYDRGPGLYDRHVPSSLCNRLVWGDDPGDYVAVAQRATADARGPVPGWCGSYGDCREAGPPVRSPALRAVHGSDRAAPSS